MIFTILFIVFMVLALPSAWPGAVTWPYGYGFLWLAVACLACIVGIPHRI